MLKHNRKILFLIILMICFASLVSPVPVLCKQNDDEMLMRIIRQHIDTNILWPAENVRIEFLSDLPKIDNLSKNITFSVESRPKEEYVGDTSFRVRIFSKNIFVREEAVRVRIEVLREFVVSQKSIAKDSILSSDDVTVQKKWVRSIPMNAVTSLDEVLGKNIIIGIRPNMQITRNMLKEVMPVKKGKMVQVVLDNGVMKMMASGMAEEDGAEDTIIKVRNLSSNKTIFARVVGQAKVQVDF